MASKCVDVIIIRGHILFCFNFFFKTALTLFFSNLVNVLTECLVTFTNLPLVKLQALADMELVCFTGHH